MLLRFMASGKSHHCFGSRVGTCDDHPINRPQSPHDPRIFFQLLLTKTFPDRLVARKLTKGHGEVGWRWQDTGPEARPLPVAPWVCWNWRFFMGQMTRCWMNQLKQTKTTHSHFPSDTNISAECRIDQNRWPCFQNWCWLPLLGGDFYQAMVFLHHPIFARHIYRRTLGRKKKNFRYHHCKTFYVFFLIFCRLSPHVFLKKKTLALSWHWAARA